MPPYYPFHCWAVYASMPPFHPFHCWERVLRLPFTRFTVGEKKGQKRLFLPPRVCKKGAERLILASQDLRMEENTHPGTLLGPLRGYPHPCIPRFVGGSSQLGYWSRARTRRTCTIRVAESAGLTGRLKGLGYLPGKRRKGQNRALLTGKGGYMGPGRPLRHPFHCWAGMSPSRS